ncbi:MAG: hypothetical protein PF508_13630 [Spirochaeta sp.]|jgi:hypothetical protein|nr:hypothetical protein [Spirochaeta sp.]
MASKRLVATFAWSTLVLITGGAWLPALASAEPERVEITGVVRRVGSEPLTDLVVTHGDVDYIVPDDAERVFEEYLGTSIRVTATVRQEELQTVDGSFTVVRHYLVDPVVLKEE